MWAEATNQPLAEDLENGSTNDGVQGAHDGVVEIPEAANTESADEVDGDRDEDRHEG